MYKSKTSPSSIQSRKKADGEQERYNQNKQNASSNVSVPLLTGGVGGRVEASNLLTLQRMVGNTAVQNVLQLGKKGDQSGRGGKGDRGSRRTERKTGKKSQRDKRPGIMSDPVLGDIFIEFWHSFKQKHGGKLADYTGDRMLRKTLNELTGGTSESEHADQPLQWFFSRYLESRHPDLYQGLLGEDDTEEHEDYHQADSYESKSDEDDEYDGGGGSGSGIYA